mmetsp:Transcript_3418/g.21363  ORF Transcript_3418/g.21363 Transcript_3418/m.21363 type:complete len:424 (-) Transcript_3418:97-1368(-)
MEAQRASFVQQATHPHASPSRQMHLLSSQRHCRFERRASPRRSESRNRFDRVGDELGALRIESERFGHAQGVFQVVQASLQRHVRRSLPFTRVGIQQRGTCTSVQHRGQLPREVVRVLDACIHPKSTRWREQMRCIAHQVHVRLRKRAGNRTRHRPWTCVHHLEVGQGGVDARLDGLARRRVVPRFQRLQWRETRHLKHEFATCEVVRHQHAHHGRVGDEVEHGRTRFSQLPSQFRGTEVHVHQMLHAELAFHGGAHRIAHHGTCTVGADEAVEPSDVFHWTVRTARHAYADACAVRFVSHDACVEAHVGLSHLFRASQQQRQETMLCKVSGRVRRQHACRRRALRVFLRVWMFHHTEHVVFVHFPAVDEPLPQGFRRRGVAHVCDEVGIATVQDFQGPRRQVMCSWMVGQLLVPFEDHRGHA